MSIKLRLYRLASVLIAVAVVLSVSGCGKENSDESDSEVSYGMPSAVTVMTSLKPESMASFVSLGNGLLLTVWQDYNAQKSHFDILDITKDKIVKSAVVDGNYSIEEKAYDNGKALLTDFENSEFLVIDSNLTISGPVRVPNIYGRFSNNLEKYYYTDDDVLYVYDVASGVSGKVKLEYDMRMSLTGISYDGTLLSSLVYVSPYSLTSASAVIDIATGNFLLLKSGYDLPKFCSNNPYYLVYNTDDKNYSLTYGNPLCTMYNASTSKIGIDNATCSVIADSNYMYAYSDTEAIDVTTGVGQSTFSKAVLCKLSDKIMCANLTDYGIKSMILDQVYMTEERLIAACNYYNGSFSVFIIDPQLLEFKSVDTASLDEPSERVEKELINNYFDELKGSDVSTDLKDARVTADKIENKYGVRLLLSSQCEKLIKNCSYTAMLSSDVKWIDEAESISYALKNIEKALSKYPSGFIRQLRNGADEGGVRIMLLGPIDSDYSVVGFQYDFGQWFNIGIDITCSNIEGITYHELWHAIECKIYSIDKSLFVDEEWNKCNPKGFEYYYSYDSNMKNADEYAFFGSASAKKCYFVDSYAKTFPKEDRARIMEYVMPDGDAARDLMKSNAIKQKLKIMSDAVRKCFDTSDWDTPIWEKRL